MNVSRVTMAGPLAFKAQTTIKAPESLLSKEDREYFESVGQAIGTPADTIEITISDLQDSKSNPTVKTYKVTKNYHFENSQNRFEKQGTINIPYIKNGEVVEKNSPKNYIAQTLEKLIKAE